MLWKHNKKKSLIGRGEMIIKNLVKLSLVVSLTFGVLPGFSKDSKTGWPQWRGPARDGISTETGIIKSWPETGPKVLWKSDSGDGYSAMSIVDGRLYTVWGQLSDEIVVCLDANSGEQLWQLKIDSKFTNNFGHGSRSTPSVDGGIVYAISAKAKPSTP